MDRRLAALALLAAFIAVPAFAQPAAKANPKAFKHAPLTPECQKLRDEYLKSQDANQAARGSEHDDGERARGGHPEQKALRKDFEARCGALPPEMTPKTKDDAKAATAASTTAAAPPKAGDKPRNLADAINGDKKEREQGAVTATAAAAPAVPYDPPRKAGPNMGTGSSSTRCAQLHQSLRDSVARTNACGKTKGCKKNEEFSYEQLRSAYQSGCGELPDDAKPRKKRG